MKNLFFIVFAFLCININAQNWGFLKATDFDIANMDADNNWTYDENNDRFFYIQALKGEPLYANGNELEFTKGLKFTCFSSTGIRIDGNHKCLNINSSSSTIIVPNITAGSKFTIKYKSSNAPRTITTTNLQDPDGQPITSFTVPAGKDVTETAFVSKNGDITLSPNGGMYIYSITVISPNKD